MRGDPGDIDDLLVTDEHNPTAPRGRYRFLWFLLAIALVAGAVYGTLKLSERLNPSTGEAAGPSERVASSFTASAEASVERFELPASCGELYPESIAQRLSSESGMAVNPQWYLDDEGEPNQANWLEGSHRQLGETVAEAPRLTCAWVPDEAPTPGPDDEIPAGASASDLISAGIVTLVADLTPAQLQVAIKDVSSRAEKCYEENGGLRCNLSSKTEVGIGDDAHEQLTGESYFVRGNLLFASRWLTNIDGYTADVTAHVVEGQ